MSAPAFNLATVQGLIAHYAKLQGLDSWKITSEIVPGLLHHGEDAWAIVESDPAARKAHVRVRDLATTPIDAADPWHELKVTISHELWHPWVAWLLAEPSVDREEALVEAAAQAVVRAAGADARVMARSIQAIPAAVRARVATVRANMSGHETAHDPHSGKFTSGSGGGGGGSGNDNGAGSGAGASTKSHHILPTNDTTVEKMAGSVRGQTGNAYDPRHQIDWAHVKAQEYRRPVFMVKNPKYVPGNLNTGGPYRLESKPPKGEHHEVRPDGSIVYHPPPPKKSKAPKAGAQKTVGARAVTRARGGTQMDGKAVLAAIKDQDEAGALAILEQWAAEQIAAAQGDVAPEPDGDETMMDDDLNPPIEAREDGGGMDQNKPGGPPAARPMARDNEDENARRARKAADSLNRSAIRARVHEARVVDGITLAPELEKMILAETDIDAAEKLLKVAKIARGDGAPARARGADPARPVGAPPPPNEDKPKYTEAELVKEGINPILAKQIASETDHRVADLTLSAARARIASNGNPWASKPNGGAS